MSSFARLCVLALIALFQLGVWQAAWSSGSANLISAIQANDEMSGGDADEEDAPPGSTDERSIPPMADDIFEILVMPVDVPRVRSADPDGRAGLALYELRRGRPAPDTPDKPPRA